MIEQLMTALHALIAEHKIDLLKHYPDDLNVHDRRILERYMMPGATLAWVVGHTHTHLVPLGIHPKQNDMVKCFTHLSRSDHFFLIKFGANGDFNITQLNRDVFEALSSHPIAYAVQACGPDFTLLKRDKTIGRFHLQVLPYALDTANPRRKVTFSPAPGISDFERTVLALWGEEAARESAGSHFTHVEVEWPAAVEAPAPKQRSTPRNAAAYAVQ